MQQTLFIVVFVVGIAIALAAYKWKKKVENKIGNDLNALIESNDWCGVCRILRKQLIIWGSLLVLVVGLFIVRVIKGGQAYTPIIVCAFVIWRFSKLVRLYSISHKAMKTMEQDDAEPRQMPVDEFLYGCKVTHIEVPVAEIKQVWLDAYEKGKQEGFCPVLLEVDECFYDSLDDKSEWFDNTKFHEWQSAMLRADHNNGHAFLRKRFEAIKEDYGNSDDWEKNVVGTDEAFPSIDDFGIGNGSNVYLVEIPVKEPWQVFAYIPMGDWNECPYAEEHMAVAKYWYEKYGAVVAHISNDMIQYYLPQPVKGETMPLAEEHMGYCDDSVFQGENLTSLAAEIKKSTVWCFWWD